MVRHHLAECRHTGVHGVVAVVEQVTNLSDRGFHSTHINHGGGVSGTKARGRQKIRQTRRNAHRWEGRWVGGQAKRHAGRQPARQAEKQARRQVGTRTNRQVGREARRQASKQPDPLSDRWEGRDSNLSSTGIKKKQETLAARKSKHKT